MSRTRSLRAEFLFDLPSGTSVEVMAAESGSGLHVVLDLHNDVTTLTVLAEALRATVVGIDEQRELLLATGG
jgi:hypothetical protein